MKNRENKKYVIKVFEAQWDTLHQSSVKPFFEQLKRETCNSADDTVSHDALYKYHVFNNTDGLRAQLSEYDIGVEKRLKIAYFACHGRDGAICAVQDISRTRLKNIVSPLTKYDGLYFGTCDFVNPKTANDILTTSKHIKWIAGYEAATPWLEGTICDLVFFRNMLSGVFCRPNKNIKWDLPKNPAYAAIYLYMTYPISQDLRFSLYYRTKNGFQSTLNYFRAVKKYMDKDISRTIDNLGNI